MLYLRIAVLLGALAVGFGIYTIIRDTIERAIVNQLLIESLENAAENAKEKDNSDAKIDNVRDNDLSKFGCKWLYKTDPNYCGP